MLILKVTLKKYLFINDYLASLKVTPFKHNTVMPAFFEILNTLLKNAFWYHQQLQFRFFFYILKRSKTLFFLSYLQFCGEETEEKQEEGYKGYHMAYKTDNLQFLLLL